jgi:hypothetical protein
MRSETIAASAALFMVMSASGSWAQEATALSAAPTASALQVTPSVEIDYDSNIARSSREAAAARGLSLADELATPSVDFLVARQLGREILFLKGNASYLFHYHDKILDRENIDATAGINAHVARCQEVATGTESIQQSDLTDQTKQVVKNVINAPSVELDVDCGRAIGFAPTLSLTESWRDNSAALYKQNNSNTRGANAGISYHAPVLGSITAFGSYAQTDFTNSLILVGATPELYSYVLYSGGVTYTRRLGARLQGSATLSYTVLDPNSSASRGFQGVTYDVTGSYQLGSKILISAVGSRATAPSSQIGGNYTVNEIYEVDFLYKTGGRISLTLTGRRKSSDYNLASGPSQLFVTRSTTNSALASAAYALNGRIALTLTVSDDEHSANAVGASYSSTRVALGASATF